MSDTPRTDLLLIVHNMEPKPMTLIKHAQELERELEAANAFIKRLEEAGDAMVNGGWNEPHLSGAWREAKEGKL